MKLLRQITEAVTYRVSELAIPGRGFYTLTEVVDQYRLPVVDYVLKTGVGAAPDGQVVTDQTLLRDAVRFVNSVKE